MNHQDKVKSRIYWQYKNSPKLIQLLMSLPSIAQSTIEDQLAKVKAMLDIDYAEGEQLDICGRIVGYLSRPAAKIYPSCVFAPVNDDLFRVLIKAKIYRNNSIATVDEVKTAADYILDTETRCLDGQDMTMRMIWFSHDVSIPVQQLVRDYDLIPRPQGVGTREHRVLTYKPFGFGPYYSNFRAPFWHGDGLHLYYSVHFQFSFDNEAGILNGKLISEDVVISDLDVKLTIIDENGEEKTVFVVTDENGEFSIQMEKTGRYTAVAQTQIITPDCAQAIVTSDPYDFRWHIYVTSISASVAELEVPRGESVTFTVDVQPDNADNKAFTVHLSDGSVADIIVIGNQVTVTGLVKGSDEIIITSEDTGMTATVLLNVIIVPETKFVMRMDSLERPLFYLGDITENFTIDYGDGVQSQDYRISAITANTGVVYATRDLTIGEEYTITVKRSDTMRFFVSSTSNVTFNSLLEIVNVSGERAGMRAFAQGKTTLRKVHARAFDELEQCTDFGYVFYGCTSLDELPEGLFANTTKASQFDYLCYGCTGLITISAGTFSGASGATSFYLAFYGCSKLANVPSGLFAGMDKVTTFFGVFRGCTSLVQPGSGIFNGCSSATDFGYIFYGCSALVYPGDAVLQGCTSARDLAYAFYGCAKLVSLPDGMLDDVPGGTFNYAFQNCTALTDLPVGLFGNCTSSTSFNATFRGCTSLSNIPERLFAGLNKVTTFSYCFNGCSALTSVGDYVFEGCESNTAFNFLFTSCSNIINVGYNIFQGCTSVTAFSNVFSNCTRLENMPLFTDCNKVTTFIYAFSDCSSLKAINENAFMNKSLVTTFAYVFNGCKSLVSVPSGVFKGCSAVTVFDYAFQNCTSLETLSGDIFDGCAKVTGIQYLFSGCSSLNEPSETLFNSFGAVTSTTLRIFAGCASLVSVPESLFAYMVNVTALPSLFYGCSGLSDVPENLFAACTKLTSAEAIFYGCSSLTDIPEDIFAANTLITTFNTTFRESGLKSVSPELFKNNINATTFSYVFYACKQLESLPEGLFKYNALATTFTYMCDGCTDLKSVGEGIFDNSSATTLTRAFAGCSNLSNNINEMMSLSIYNKITGTANLFYGCTHVTGSGLQLIDAFVSVTSTTAKAGTFNGCTGLDDYADIPSAWK